MTGGTVPLKALHLPLLPAAVWQGRLLPGPGPRAEAGNHQVSQRHLAVRFHNILDIHPCCTLYSIINQTKLPGVLHFAVLASAENFDPVFSWM